MGGASPESTLKSECGDALRLGTRLRLLAPTQVFARSAEATSGGELVHDGKPLAATYVLSEPGLRLDGAIVARDPV